MENIRQIDKNGVWLHNTGEFPVPDYGRQAEGQELVMLAPGSVTRIRMNDYLASQPTLVKVDDPFGEPEKKPSGKKSTTAPAAPVEPPAE